MPEAAGNRCFAHTQNRPQHLSGLSGSTVMRQSCADTLAPEEPDAFITHVRVCGGGRLGNHRLYPEGLLSASVPAVHFPHGGYPEPRGRRLPCRERCTPVAQTFHHGGSPARHSAGPAGRVSALLRLHGCTYNGIIRCAAATPPANQPRSRAGVVAV